MWSFSLKDEILKLAALHNLDSATVITEIADVVAISAIALDAQGGLSKVRFEERLHSFEGLALQFYAARQRQHRLFLETARG